MHGMNRLLAKRVRRAGATCGAVAISALVLACGGDGDGSGQTVGAAEGAKVIDPSAMKNARGTVNVCQAKDIAGNTVDAIKTFNAQNTGVKAKLVELGSSADEQRSLFVQRVEAKSSECDVFASDVIWTAEFASQKWIYDMTPYVKSRASELIGSTVTAATYRGRIWGMPQDSGAALLYYRTDKVTSAPATWQQVYAEAPAGGVVYQGAPYEGLTCDFLELAFAAGGSVLSGDGKKATIDSPQNVKALQLMVDGVRDGKAANGVTTYMEEESRRYWEAGKATFMRNWSYAYALGEKKGTKVSGKFAVAPLPAFEGAGKAGILGGHNMVISVYSKNPGAALKFIDFYTSPEWEKHTMDAYSLPVATASVYDDPAIQRKYAYAAELKAAIAQAKPRPVSPVYPQISQAIYNNVNAALTGKESPAAALKTAQAQIQNALATF
jgi:trehalose/maltose transport system substrate-binding protein